VTGQFIAPQTMYCEVFFSSVHLYTYKHTRIL